MFDLSYGIEERAIEKGIEKGIEPGRLNLIRHMLSQHMPVEDIKKYSGASDKEIQKAEEEMILNNNK